MTGKAKAQHLMWFVQEHASFRFEFSNEDPHLTEEQYVNIDTFACLAIGPTAIGLFLTHAAALCMISGGTGM
eukprot:COSAG02_NODE_471_length_21662_cov_70.510040_24_plen_72_part_00